MKKVDFCVSLGALRQYGTWEQQMYTLGLDLTNSPVGLVVDRLLDSMRDFNIDWSYDTKLGIDWIVEWAFSPESDNFIQTRHGRTWDLTGASTLYEFLLFMNEYGWEE